MGRRKESVSDDEYEPADDEDELIGQLRQMFRKPKPGKELTKPVNFVITCGNHEWRVHEEPIIQQSGFFKMMSDSKFRESAEHTANLPEDEPEIIARMVMYCYFKEYPLSSNSELRFGVPTVTKVMKENMIEVDEEFAAPNEHKFDAVLHLKMFILADKFDLGSLARYARERIIAVLKYEPEGLWPCLQMLQDLPDHLVEDIESRLARFIESCGSSSSWVTIGMVKRLEELSPGLAAALSDETKEKRFGRNQYFRRPGEKISELPQPRQVWWEILQLEARRVAPLDLELERLGNEVVEYGRSSTCQHSYTREQGQDWIMWKTPMISLACTVLMEKMPKHKSRAKGKRSTEPFKGSAHLPSPFRFIGWCRRTSLLSLHTGLRAIARALPSFEPF